MQFKNVLVDGKCFKVALPGFTIMFLFAELLWDLYPIVLFALHTKSNVLN